LVDPESSDTSRNNSDEECVPDLREGTSEDSDDPDNNESEVRNQCSWFTTASQSGGWLPVIPRSFHYWQPAPRWRLLPWLANPGKPASHEPPRRIEGRHLSHCVNSGKEGGKWGKP